MKKHILVIAQYFYPEQFRINDICSEWIGRGYNVTVLTGIPNYPEGKYYKGYGLFKKRIEKYNGIKIIRIPLIPRGKNPFMLVLNYFSFVVSGFFFAYFSGIKADLVFIYEVSPMTQALPGVWFSKHRKVPCFLYVTDLWPENVEILSGLKSKPIFIAIGKMVDYIYKRCNRILVSSRSFIEAIEKRGVPPEKIEFWPQYAEDFYVPISKDEGAKVMEIPKDGVFNIIFAGNIGQAQGLDVLPKAAKILKERNIRVRFNIVGDGRAKNELIKDVNDNNVNKYFNFVNKQPATSIPAFLKACDATIICFSKSRIFELYLPGKLQSCMACGVPIIVCADGEVCEVINEANAGLCSPAGDAEKLANIIIQMVGKSPQQLIELGSNAVKYYKEHFEKRKLLNRIDEIFIKETGDKVNV